MTNEQIIEFMALGSLGMLAVIAGVLMLVVVHKVSKPSDQISHLSLSGLKQVAKLSMWGVWLAASAGTLGSLYFSEVVGLAPCKLCWYQRIFLYPLVPILAVAIGKKDKKIAEYVLVLSMLGAVIAGYQTLLQWGLVAEITRCEIGVAVSCADDYGRTFGFVTIPFMSLVAFVFIVTLMLVSLGIEGMKQPVKTNGKHR